MKKLFLAAFAVVVIAAGTIQAQTNTAVKGNENKIETKIDQAKDPNKKKTGKSEDVKQPVKKVTGKKQKASHVKPVVKKSEPAPLKTQENK